MWQDDEGPPKRPRPLPRPVLPPWRLTGGDSEGTQLVVHEDGLSRRSQKRMSTMGQDPDGVPHKLEEDQADEDKGEWEVVPPGHPAFIFQSLSSGSENLAMHERQVKFQHAELLAMTADLEVRQRKMERDECESLARMEQQNKTRAEFVKKQFDEMQVNTGIPYLRSW
jgi:hypothetical protein